MRIAITGGSGFIGHHLAQRLADAGHELVLISRTRRGAETTKQKFVTSDLSDRTVHGSTMRCHISGS